MLTFKRKLILTRSQASRLDGWMGVCRLVYNMCIEIRNEAYKNQQITVHRFALERQMTEIRDIDWVRDVPYESLAHAIHKIDLAYKKFFKGSGFPKFASKKRMNSIQFRQCVRVSDNKIKLPKIGWVKMFKDSSISGKIIIVNIKRDSGAYYACITTDAVKSIQNQDESQILGLDMGTKRFYTDSNGGYSLNPKHFKKYENRLRIEGRSLARKKRFGKNWIKQAHKLRRLHYKIASVRKDYLHKESTKIAKLYHYVVMEDLNIAGMSKNRTLSKAILDSGWGEFRKMLAYKTTVIPVDPKFTSQICNDCGEKDKKSRINQSEFVCTSCGAKSHADENAAKNILDRGAVIIRQRKAVA